MVECDEHLGWTEEFASCPRCLVLYHKAVADKKRQKVAELEAELRDYKQRIIDLQCEIELMADEE